MLSETEITTVEIDLLIEGIWRIHGYDFRDYARASLQRRLSLWLSNSGYANFGSALPFLLRDAVLCNTLVQGVTVNTSEMFRDPLFFKILREKVLPYLSTFSHAKIWLAGCAGGEEVYSLAILLREAGLEDRCRIYATDLNQDILKKAKSGIFPLRNMQQYTRNYQRAGGQAEFSDYYVARYDRAIIDSQLTRNVVFAAHNLATDADFSEMQLILCRNVMIYFKLSLKEKVLNLFDRCLTAGGFLCLGSKESLDGRHIAPDYQETEPRSRIYCKKYISPAKRDIS
ncbi:MAG: protein-glutamate O-methyltransferase CheR [Burkholderiales bacterium]|nr:protein-glutamate O-methyltransferase CheR [Burkholderiales bacterium]